MEFRRWEAHPEAWKEVWRGWCIGEEAFRRDLLKAVAEKSGQSPYGEELRESDEQKAERIIAEEMKIHRWHQATLAARANGDPGKVRIAGRLRKETTMTLKWIAQHLHMGTWTYFATACIIQRREKLQILRTDPFTPNGGL